MLSQRKLPTHRANVPQKWPILPPLLPARDCQFAKLCDSFYHVNKPSQEAEPKQTTRLKLASKAQCEFDKREQSLTLWTEPRVIGLCPIADVQVFLGPGTPLGTANNSLDILRFMSCQWGLGPIYNNAKTSLRRDLVVACLSSTRAVTVPSCSMGRNLTLLHNQAKDNELL